MTMSKQQTERGAANISDMLLQLEKLMSALMDQSIALACESDWNSDGDPLNGWPPSQADLLAASSKLENIYFDMARITGRDPWNLLRFHGI
jgi:hypothetical protein